jgi:uncharacterized membrane protein SpoIIM required for sporulation
MLGTAVPAAGRVETVPFVVSALLFAAGYTASYPAVAYEVGFLTWYPLRVWRRVREHVSPEDGWLRLTVFLFSFNAASLLANLLSGFLVVLPYAFAVFLGLNVGVVAVEKGGTAGLVSTVVNPVAWLELPAAWASLALGVQLGREAAEGPAEALSAFPELAEVYALVVLPLLVAAAVLEATLIRALAGSAP